MAHRSSPLPPRILGLLTLSWLALTAACGTKQLKPEDPLVIKTDKGHVRGTSEADLRVFRGIPYAAPPVGELRFQPPQAHPGWTEVREASALGPACPQSGLMIQQQLAWSEDCLTLNVWTHADGKRRPVMVFLHGGGFIDGAGSEPLYEGSQLARAGDVVVVNLNYRLGPLGFMTTRALASAGSRGNLGIRDQIAALEWAQHNIAAFGGDPDRVLLFGESAGASSVCAHLASPLSKGLFQRAIVQSGPGCAGVLSPETQAPLTQLSAFEFGERIVSHTPCVNASDEVACLRQLPAQALLDAVAVQVKAQGANAVLGFQTLIDDGVLSRDPLAAFADGSAHDVPLLIGSNANEWSLFTLGGFDQAPKTEEEYHGRLGASFGPLAPALLEAYPARDFPTPAHAYESLITDLTFTCPAERIAELASGGEQPAFRYYFTHSLAGGLGQRLGATHMLELGFVFDRIQSVPMGNQLAVSDTDVRMVSRIQKAWASFAWEGKPTLDPSWPATTPAAPSIALLGDPSSIVTQLPGNRCAKLRALGLVR